MRRYPVLKVKTGVYRALGTILFFQGFFSPDLYHFFHELWNSWFIFNWSLTIEWVSGWVSLDRSCTAGNKIPTRMFFLFYEVDSAFTKIRAIPKVSLWWHIYRISFVIFALPLALGLTWIPTTLDIYHISLKNFSLALFPSWNTPVEKQKCDIFIQIYWK